MNITVSIQKPLDHKEIDNRWIQLKIKNLFPSRSNPASCIQAANVYIHGGCNRQIGLLDDLHSVRIQDSACEWVTMPQKGDKPGYLRNHTMVSYLSFLIVYGGQRNMLENSNKIYIYDLRTGIWRQPTCQQLDKNLPAIDSHLAIIHCKYNIILESDIYIFGGYNSDKANYSSQIIRISLQKILENKIVFEFIKPQSQIKPCPRSSFGGCLFGNQIYIFGGACQNGNLCDLWVFNIVNRKWQEIENGKQSNYWPQKRKGHTLILHVNSGNLFMFGGIKEITKQQNDISIFLRQRKKWVKVHTNTNSLYDPSPTIKKQIENSPTILENKRKKSRLGRDNSFRLSIKSTTCYGGMKKFNTNASISKQNTTMKTEVQGILQRKMSVVQQKKYREFLNRKKKLLKDIGLGLEKYKRSHSPTSEALIYSIECIGQQKNNQEKQLIKENFQIPKVIFDQEKGYVIGKKPCARDGHIGLPHGDLMIIIGGDRHMISFNDSFIFKMDKAMESVHRYL